MLCSSASYWDFKSSKKQGKGIIPNIITVPVIAVGALLAGAHWCAALMDASLGILLFLPLVLVGFAGMGDAKLCAAAAALVGFTTAGLGAWIGTVICALWIAIRKARKGSLKTWLSGHIAALAQLQAGCKPEGKTIPFAPFFAAGMILALAWRWWA